MDWLGGVEGSLPGPATVPLVRSAPLIDEIGTAWQRYGRPTSSAPPSMFGDRPFYADSSLQLARHYTSPYLHRYTLATVAPRR
ncbi:hypothetical protein VTK56DRAFT_928 [Thermocarpiscus australiensis]